MKKIDNSECLKRFGDFVKEGRQRKDLTQTDLAMLVGITQSHISHIEQGDREISLVTALKICEYLGVDLRDFIAKYM